MALLRDHVVPISGGTAGLGASIPTGSEMRQIMRRSLTVRLLSSDCASVWFAGDSAVYRALPGSAGIAVPGVTG
jgi:hypothetical protein